jgi:DNA-binding XRE family transcriptional regulator
MDTIKELRWKFSRNLIQFRMAMGLSQKEVGEYIGLHQSTVAKLEAGKTLPSYKTWQSLARLFRVSMGRLVT